MTAPFFIAATEPTRRPTLPRLNALNEIVEAVAAVYGIAGADIINGGRTKAISEARLLCCLLARRCTRLSSVEIGMVLGRDHTTVLAAIKSIEGKRVHDQWLDATAQELLERFGAAEQRSVQ